MRGLRLRSSFVAALVLLTVQLASLFLCDAIGSITATASAINGKPLVMTAIGGFDRFVVTGALLLLATTLAIAALRRLALLSSTAPAPIEETFS